LYLLDTHVLVWAVDRPELLSRRATSIIKSEMIGVSAASLWELLVKKDKEDAPVKNPNGWWQQFVTSAGVKVLAIEGYHVRHLDTLPPIHKDPFDRILICQCIHEGLKLVTNDKHISRYGRVVSAVW
jgi:PIN domain nuclease of toxin-antitoxin system